MNITALKVQELKNAIFIRFSLEGDFRLLTNEVGDTFEWMGEAIDFVRANHSDQQVELACFENACLGNGEWDNL